MLKGLAKASTQAERLSDTTIKRNTGREVAIPGWPTRFQKQDNIRIWQTIAKDVSLNSTGSQREAGCHGGAGAAKRNRIPEGIKSSA